MSYLTGDYWHLVDKGLVRDTNEDSAIALVNAYGNVLLAVADGMGGANKGEYASNYLLGYLKNEFLNLEEEIENPKAIIKWLNSKIKEANLAIFEKGESKEDFKGMGTTLSLCFIVKDNLITAQVGDSRIYLLKDNKLEQISVDQTYATYLLHHKKISESEVAVHKKRHMLTNAIGTKKTCNVDINLYKYSRERILICSDGLYNNVSSLIIESIVRGNDSLDKKCQELIAFGNANGGSDNMAVVIWESK